MTVNLRPDHSILQDIGVFQGLDRPAEDEVLERAHLRHVEKGEAVFHEGDEARTFFVLLDGRIKAVRTTADGEKVVLHVINPGEFFGCMALTGGQLYPGTAEALTESVIISWDVDTLRGLVNRHPGIAIKALATMGRRMSESNDRVAQLQTERAERRIAHALLRLVRHAGKRSDAGVAIDFPLTRQDLAQMAGVTLHTASRTLALWESQGILAGGRAAVTVLQPHALVAIAQELPGSEEAKES